MPQGYPHGHDERTLVTEAGMASAAGVAASRASGGRVEGWLAGDHHIHTQFSSDGLYRVIDHVQHAHAYGLDWMVITDHASATHAKIGVEVVNPHIRAARSEFDMLVFQGLEWNIPAAEHGTVFVHPGVNEVAVLKQFENEYDGILRRAEGSSPANERLALEGLAFLASAKSSKRVQDALMLANHPARKGIDSPHELRDWRDAPGRIAVGMEGAPGHQAAGIPAPHGPGHPRGEYGNGPTADSFAPYPLESYRTFGGFDWMTATVGGLWDSMLAEGRPWWVTANSDSHAVHLDGAMLPAGGHFHSEGHHADPIYGPGRAERGDFWPGYFSRTMVGARRRDYASVMQALREGRVWVDHGRLVGNLDVTVEAGGAHAGLGGVVMAERGSRVTLQVTVTKAHLPNWAEILPNLATVDAISGPVTGPASDRDSFSAAHTRVVRSWDLSRSPAGEALALRLDLGRVDDRGLYVRLRGSDGNRLAAGPGGAKVDPAGPIIDAIGDADPWKDLWFYTNPIWVLPAQ